MTVVITPAPAPSYSLSAFGLTVTPDTNHRGLPQRIRKAQTVGRTYSFSATVAGDFKAGCHEFGWSEVARLAGELGLDHIAPADTTTHA